MFKLGHDDCCIAAGKIIQSRTGVDLYSDIIGSYNGFSAASGVLRDKYGVANLRELLDKYLNRTDTPIDGDLALVPIADVIVMNRRVADTKHDVFKYTIGVVNGDRIVIELPKGPKTVRRDNYALFWSTGEVKNGGQ
jgi:hypothetical protein